MNVTFPIIPPTSYPLPNICARSLHGTLLYLGFSKREVKRKCTVHTSSTIILSRNTIQKHDHIHIPYQNNNQFKTNQILRIQLNQLEIGKTQKTPPTIPM